MEPNSNPIGTLSVVLLLAQDTATTATFYREAIEISLREEVHDGRHRHYAGQLGSLYFTIQPSLDLVEPGSRKGYDFLQLCFTVADLEDFLRDIERKGITPLHEPKHFEGTQYVTLLDPDGRHVRVMTPWQKEH